MKNFFGKNILYIDVIKIIACFLVIINHTSSIMFNHQASNVDFVYTLYFSICKMAVPLFIMCTGALILDKSYNYKKVFKSIFRVFVPLLILSFIIYIKNVGFSNINIIYFIGEFIYGPSITALWYLYMLIGLYLVTPFIQKMIKDFKDKDYIIFASIFLLIPSLINLVRVYLPFTPSPYFTYAFFPNLLGYYILGSYFSKLKRNKKCLLISIIVFIISYIGMILSMYIPYLKDGVLSYALDNYVALPVALMAISFFYIIKYIFGKSSSPRFISEVAKTTFGIYLIHFILNYKIYNMVFIPILESNVYVGILLLYIVTFVVCSIIIWILRRIPIIKDFL